MKQDSVVTFSRRELYDLVWSKPMTHIAKSFGMSDVAMRKHCVKNSIPTPTVGYWAKLAHGKKARRPELPVSDKLPEDREIRIFRRPIFEVLEEGAGASAEYNARSSALKSMLVVPEKLSGKLPSSIAEIKRALLDARVNQDGFVKLGERYDIDILIGKSSIDRLVRVLVAVEQAGKEDGHRILFENSCIYWEVKGERFRCRINEIRQKRRHVPTKGELRAQALYDKDHACHPTLYPVRQQYRDWEYPPSGRLSLELSTVIQPYSQRPGLKRRWRDSSKESLEQRLPDVFLWLSGSYVIAREYRCNYEEEQRLKKEAEERKYKARQRYRQAEELAAFINKLSDVRFNIEKQELLLSFLDKEVEKGDWAIERLASEIHVYKEVLLHDTDMKSLQVLFAKLGVERDSPLLMPALLDPEGKPYSYWS